MSKGQSYSLAAAYFEQRGGKRSPQMSLAFDGLPETNARSILSTYFPHRIAVHNADLLDDERGIIERALSDGSLDVVFATTTLAAGVNFPFSTAVFASWSRWDQDLHSRVPINTAEFHNMAGRAGRMGTEHSAGRVVFFATTPREHVLGGEYLRLDALPELSSRIQPHRFGQLALQLVASDICKTRDELARLITSTLSAQREMSANPRAYATWLPALTEALNQLRNERMLLETAGGRLSATIVGKAVAFSGLLPQTGGFLVHYACRVGRALVDCLPGKSRVGDSGSIAFALAAAALSAPEFRPSDGVQPSRSLPYPLEKGMLFDADPIKTLLPEPVWQADIVPINAAKIAMDWTNGAEWRELERSLPDLSAGMIRDLFRNLVWVLYGFANIVAAATNIHAPLEHGRSRPSKTRGSILLYVGFRALSVALRGRSPRAFRTPHCG